MNATKEFNRGSVIFREGDPGECMYEIQTGSVGVFRDYGGENETEIAKLFSGKIFGEMGLLEHAPRSATVVVLEDGTVLTKVTEKEFYDYFVDNPVAVLNVMQQMCSRLRKTTRDYVEACHTAFDAVEAEKSGRKSKSLMARIKELCDYYSSYSFYPYY